MRAPSAQDLEARFQPLRPGDLPHEALLRVREHSKRLFGNQDRLEVAVAIAHTALDSVNATDLHRDIDVAVNRIRAQLLALETLGYVRATGIHNGKRLFSLANNEHRFWTFVVGEYDDCIKAEP